MVTDTLLRERARTICKLAAEQTSQDFPLIIDGFKNDPFGKYEKLAIELIEQTAEKAKEREMTEEQVNEEVAQYMYYLALEALKRVETKKMRKQR